MRYVFRLAILAPIVAILAGCQVMPERLKALSAGQTGCLPDAIEVSGLQAVSGGIMWNATCSGKKYLCTSLSSGKNSDQVSCALAAQ
jgi:hypothetical protein